jgi:hypothetical protein
LNAETNILIALLGVVPMLSQTAANVTFSSCLSFAEIGSIVAGDVILAPFG